MLVPLTGKKQLFQLVAEIPVIVKYPHILKYGKIENVTSGFQKKCKKGGFLEKKLYLRNGITKNLRIWESLN